MFLLYMYVDYSTYIQYVWDLSSSNRRRNAKIFRSYVHMPCCSLKCNVPDIKCLKWVAQPDLTSLLLKVFFHIVHCMLQNSSVYPCKNTAGLVSCTAFTIKYIDGFRFVILCLHLYIFVYNMCSSGYNITGKKKECQNFSWAALTCQNSNLKGFRRVTWPTCNMTLCYHMHSSKE